MASLHNNGMLSVSNSIIWRQVGLLGLAVVAVAFFLSTSFLGGDIGGSAAVVVPVVGPAEAIIESNPVTARYVLTAQSSTGWTYDVELVKCNRDCSSITTHKAMTITLDPFFYPTVYVIVPSENPPVLFVFSHSNGASELTSHTCGDDVCSSIINSMPLAWDNLLGNSEELSKTTRYETGIGGDGYPFVLVPYTTPDPLQPALLKGSFRYIRCLSERCWATSGQSSVEVADTGTAHYLALQRFNARVALGGDGFPMILYTYHDTPTNSTSTNLTRCANYDCSLRQDNAIFNFYENHDSPILDLTKGTQNNPLLAVGGSTGLHVIKCSNPACTNTPTSSTRIDSANPVEFVDIEQPEGVGEWALPRILYTQRTGGSFDQELKLTRCDTLSCTSASTPVVLDDKAFDEDFPIQAINSKYKSVVLSKSHSGVPVQYAYFCQDSRCNTFAMNGIGPGQAMLPLDFT